MCLGIFIITGFTCDDLGTAGEEDRITNTFCQLSSEGILINKAGMFQLCCKLECGISVCQSQIYSLTPCPLALILFHLTCVML